MITTLSAATRRIALSTFAALAVSVAVPQAGFASDVAAGLWKINPALSKSDSRSSRLVIDRAKGLDGTSGAFVVIDKGKVYLATPASAASSGVAATAVSTWRGMKLTQIGAGARAIVECGARCRFGEVGDRMNLTFKNVGAGEQMSTILALGQ